MTRHCNHGSYRRGAAHRAVRDQHGQALIELAFCILLLLLLSFGIVEAGRTLMAANMITHAVRDGARIAAVVPRSGRDNNGNITDFSGITNQVRSDLAQVLGTTAANQFQILPSQVTVSGVPMVKVEVKGAVPQLFGRFIFTSGGFNVDRSVYFRDEGK